MLWALFALALLTGAVAALLIIALLVFDIQARNPYASAWKPLGAAVALGALLALGIVVLVRLGAIA